MRQRLLDWTKSPYVATFFAAAETLPGKAFAVWAIDRIAVKNEALALLYDRDQAFEGIRTADSLGSAENFRRVFFNGGVPALVAPVQPFRTNERLTIQQGLFLCPTALLWSFDMNLKQLLHHANDHAGFRLELLYKLVIMPDARAELLRELNRMNINYATLFPGLDGFARSLGTNVEIGWCYA